MTTYKRGNLWMIESQVLKSLSDEGLNVDGKFGIQFSNRVDSRDGRPMCYQGRFAYSGSITKECDNAWKGSRLYNERLTDPAKQLQTRDMRIIEDMSPFALPSSYDDSSSNQVQGAARMEQIGDEAADKILSNLMECVEFPGRTAVLILDLSPQVGNFFSATMKLKQSMNTPVFYMAVCDSEVHYDWFLKYWTDELVTNFQKGSFKIAGFNPKESEPPAVSQEVAPEKPTLNVMTWLPDRDGCPGYPQGVAVPKSMVDSWYQHPIFGKAFREFYDQVVLACGTGDRWAERPVVILQSFQMQCATFMQFHSVMFIIAILCHGMQFCMQMRLRSAL